MIRPLRRAHRLMAAGLVIAVPAVVADILALRPAPVPPVREIGRHLQPLPSGFAIVTAQACCDSAVEVDIPDRALPEVLVYRAPPGTKGVDAHALLLGTITKSAEAFTLPPASREGSVLLYSPALAEVLERQEVREERAK